MMQMPAEFLDTNVLIYAFTDDPRSNRAQALLEKGCTISVQVLNEFTNVALRKLRMSWAEIHDALSLIRYLCPTIAGIDIETHDAATAIAERSRLQIFDSLIIASAIRSGSTVLWSEDMQDGMTIEGLSISNPFRLP